MESSAGGWNGIKNLYSSTIKDPAALDQPDVVRMINCGVYGFPAVYDAYKSSVIPLVNYDSHGDQQIGTCFVGGASWLLTARHCIENAASLSLRGTSVAMLERANFFAHPDDALDLALIQFDEPVFHDLAPLAIPVEDAVILDEVMALGYPNVPGFLPTLAAEAAKVSGRLAATVGRIASQPTEIFSKVPLLLITARVRGGFSGGPVVDSFGQAVGIVSREPAAQQTNGEWQAYDNLGYGTAIPSKAAVELTSAVSAGSLKALDMSGVQFRNFI